MYTHANKTHVYIYIYIYMAASILYPSLEVILKATRVTRVGRSQFFIEILDLTGG